MSKKILVVDDEEELRDFISMRLEANGYEVVTAGNGIEGLKVVVDEKPDLIISDVLMPEMDGFAFYKILKEDEATKDIPVLILTARGKMEDTFRVLGVDDFLSKPFQADELLSKIQLQLGSEATPEPESLIS